MTMIVYLDLVLITTLITDYAILKTISLVWKEKIIIYRIILALFVSLANVLLFIFPFKHLMVIRYFVGIIIVVIAYPYKSIKTTIIKIVIYYLLNIAFIGTIVIFKVKNLAMLFVALLFVIISWIIENYKGVSINENKHIYKVSIKNINFKAYLDTGNTVYYQGLPIVFINNKHMTKLNLEKIGSTIIQGIGGNTNIMIYEGPPVVMAGASIIARYAFTNINNYDVLLHRDFIGGK